MTPNAALKPTAAQLLLCSVAVSGRSVLAGVSEFRGIPGTPYLIPPVSGVWKSTAGEHGERGGGYWEPRHFLTESSVNSARPSGAESQAPQRRG
jgi:hypothetical protein